MKFLKTLLVSLMVMLGFGISSANAAVDAAITTALTAAGADGATVATAVLVVLVGIVAFKYIRRAL